MLSVEQHATINLVRRMVDLEPLTREQLEQQLDWGQESPGDAHKIGLRRLGAIMGWELGVDETNNDPAYMVVPTQRLGTEAYRCMATRSVRLAGTGMNGTDVKYGVVLSASMLRLLDEATAAMQGAWSAQR